MSPLAPISLDRDGEVPLGTQLAWVLRARIAAATLPPGERLPGARELAAQAGVNVNTVRAVYARLEDEGLLRVVHGSGTFVAASAAPAAAAAELAAAVTSEARRRGIDPRAVAAALYVEPAASRAAAASPATASPSPAVSPAQAASPAPAPVPAPAQERRALREQIAALERQLAALPALPARGDAATTPPPRPSGAGRRLSTAELERMRDELAARVGQARVQAAAASEARAGAAESDAARDATSRAGGRRLGRATLRWVPGG